VKRTTCERCGDVVIDGGARLWVESYDRAEDRTRRRAFDLCRGCVDRLGELLKGESPHERDDKAR
jgi:hypothetical protein